MKPLDAFSYYVKSNSNEGSNLAGSYVRALKYATELLRQTRPEYSDMSPIWEISSLSELEEIYKCVKSEERKKESSSFIGTSVPKSYWMNRFCSNAIRMFARFITENKESDAACSVYESSTTAESVANAISKWKVNPAFYLDEDMDAKSKEGRDILRQVKTRKNQFAFRRIVLLNYGNMCCISGLPIPAVLRASHIVGWAEDEKTRLLPTNGLCLAATYDAAFDRHLITFDEDCRMVLSPVLKDYCTNSAFISCFKKYEGKSLIKAKKFQPSQVFLAHHRELLAK